MAKLFGKRHDNVLRAFAAMECSPEFSALNFELAKYVDGQGKERSVTNMTKDGFTFLAMGFTGSAAAKFKEAYIARFNELEVQADLFGKAHGHVLRDIDGLLAVGHPNLDSLFLVHATYHDKAHKEVRGFDLTKDGFLLLAMGFKGERALQFKLAYIARFNELEAQARGQRTITPHLRN